VCRIRSADRRERIQRGDLLWQDAPRAEPGEAATLGFQHRDGRVKSAPSSLRCQGGAVREVRRRDRSQQSRIVAFGRRRAG
jgi:hypothetical protein